MSVSSQPYKGTRDFYPKNSVINQDSSIDYMIYQRYIVDTWRKTMIGLGFSEYDASIIENAEIYLAKSGEELGSKQLYSFTDKGDRKIALRPEMTPTLARMITAKEQNLRYPLRWFSIPNCFRYEAPQKGRSREFWQLNVDIIGADSPYFGDEILFVAEEVLKAFGERQLLAHGRENGYFFEILLGNRKDVDSFIERNKLTEKSTLVYKILDEWKKLFTEENRLQFAIQIGLSYDEFYLCKEFLNTSTTGVHSRLKSVRFDNSIVRGLNYYTGAVFEAFDLNPNNSRALLGGGAYNNLMDLFDGKQKNCIGFGMGDSVLFEYLKFHKLLDGHPTFENWKGINYPKIVGIIMSNPDKIDKLYEKIKELKNYEVKTTWDIDYDYTRAENKRYETLKKRGCTEIIKV